MDTKVTSSDFVLSEIWNEIPPEIWKKILSMVHNPGDHRTSTDKRLVCKIWRDVIDEHLEFELTFDDNDITTKLNIPPHVRATTWIITNLIKTNNLEELIIHQKGAIVKDLRLVGQISAENSHAICKLTTNVERILLNDLSLSQKGVMEPVVGQEQEFATFCSKLKNIALIAANLQSIEKVFGLNVPKLSKLSLNVIVTIQQMKQHHRYSSVANLMDSIFRFIETMPSLKTFKMTLDIYAMFNETVYNSVSRTHYSQIILPDVQFEYLELAIAIPLLRFWGPVIRAQKTLKSIMIFPSYDSGQANVDDKRVLYDNIICGLVASENSLTSICLYNIYVKWPINAHIFENMQNLKTLKLMLDFETDQPEMHNLSSFPISLQDVVLSNITCLTDDLLEMAENLLSITSVQLSNFKVKTQFSEDVTVGINQKVINSFASKTHIKHLSLSRIKLDDACKVKVDDKMFYICNDYRKREVRMEIDRETLTHNF